MPNEFRYAIRDAYLGKEIGDLSTVENPAALKAIKPADPS
jgi:hypothetical protein